jgi:hypothetical protein
MRVLRIAVVSLVFGLAASGCAFGIAIGVDQDRRWIPALAGEWDGGWWRDDGRVGGELWMSLREAHTHVYGQVRLTARDRHPFARFHPDSWWRDAPAGWLDVRWTHLDAAHLEGVIEPYWDPDCHCRALTTLRGWARRDRLSGTFVTRHDDGRWVTGTWHAARVSRRPVWR